MAGKTAEKNAANPSTASLRACDHCGEKAPANTLVSKLEISYDENNKKQTRRLRLIKGH
jgi:hypothetical protein